MRLDVSAKHFGAFALFAAMLFLPARSYAAADAVYVGTNGAGIYKSIDGGATWSGASTGLASQAGGMYIGSIAVDPTDSNVVYAGTQAGIFRSANAGASWTHTSNGITAASVALVTTIVIDPTNTQTIYISTGNFGDGIFKTTDGGANWAPVNNGVVTNGNLDVRDLVMDPSDPNTLYLTGVTGVQTHKTTDGAATWTPVLAGFNYALAIHPTSTNIVYLAGPVGLLNKSVDGGINWFGSSSGMTSVGIFTLLVDPRSPDTIYAGTTVGSNPFGGLLFRSDDAAASWTPMNAGLATDVVFDLSLDTTEPATLYATTSDGVFKTVDGGATWNSANAGLPDINMQAVALALTPATPFTSAAEIIADLSGATGPLNKGQANSLLNKLERVEARLNGGNVRAACGQLGAFINQVNDLVASATLTESEAAPLLAIANEIAASVPCSF